MNGSSGRPELDELRGLLVKAFGIPASIEEFTGRLPREESRRLLNAKYQELGFKDYGLLLTEGGEAQNMYFLAPAIAFARSLRRGYADVADIVIRCVARNSEPLRRSGCYEKVLEMIELALWEWLENYRPRDAWQQGISGPLALVACIENGQNRDDFLDSLCEYGLQWEGRLLADKILGRMAELHGVSRHSAHLLDALLCSSWEPDFRAHLHANRVFRDFKEDKQKQLDHWELARPLIEATCPEEYVLGLAGVLELGPR